jgi:ribosomal protein L37AE/L43A
MQQQTKTVKKFPQPCVFCGSLLVVEADARFGRPAYGEKLWQCGGCGSFIREGARKPTI